MSKFVTKLISSRVLCTSITNSGPSWFDRFTAYTTVWGKMSQNSYLREFLAQKSQIVFPADLTVLWLITIVWAKLSQNSISPPVLSISVTTRLLSWFDRVSAYYNCMSEKIKKLISRRVLCTSVTNRVLRWFDRITAFSLSMSENFTKFISPRVFFTSITNRVLSWFDGCMAFCKCMSKNITKLISPRVFV